MLKGMTMKMYLLSLGAGLLVGVIYSLLNVRSPAPPVIALVGLLGILVGEQAVPLVKRLMSGNPVNISWFNSHCIPHVFGNCRPVPHIILLLRATSRLHGRSANADPPRFSGCSVRPGAP